MVHKSGESCEVSNILHKLPIECHHITVSEEARYLLIYLYTYISSDCICNSPNYAEGQEHIGCHSDFQALH